VYSPFANPYRRTVCPQTLVTYNRSWNTFVSTLLVPRISYRLPPYCTLRFNRIAKPLGAPVDSNALPAFTFHPVGRPDLVHYNNLRSQLLTGPSTYCGPAGHNLGDFGGRSLGRLALHFLLARTNRWCCVRPSSPPPVTQCLVVQGGTDHVNSSLGVAHHPLRAINHRLHSARCCRPCLSTVKTAGSLGRYCRHSSCLRPSLACGVHQLTHIMSFGELGGPAGGHLPQRVNHNRSC
jgi:hypothetical protein